MQLFHTTASIPNNHEIRSASQNQFNKHRSGRELKIVLDVKLSSSRISHPNNVAKSLKRKI